MTIEGDVIAFELKNPHAWLHLAVVDENGTAQKFSAEWSNAARLKQAGFSAASFKPGEHLILTGSPGRNPAERTDPSENDPAPVRWLEVAEERTGR